MDNRQINFRFAGKNDFEPIARLHFLDTQNCEKGFFRFFLDKIILFKEIGAEMIIAEDAGELVGVIVFIRNYKLVNKAFWDPQHVSKFLSRLITGYYGFNKKLFRKVILILRFNLNLKTFIINRRIRLPKAKVLSLVVKENHRRKGIASTLLKKTFEFFLENSIHCLHLTVVENNYGAIAMYEKLGFRIIGEYMESTGRSHIMINKLSPRYQSYSDCNHNPKIKRLDFKFKMKKIFKYCFVFFITAIGYTMIKNYFSSGRKRIFILTYHKISEEAQDNYSVRKNDFENQIDYLLRNFHIVSLQNIIDYLRGQAELVNNSLAITFDDGYQEVFLSAYPILKRYNLPATVFLVTNFIDTDKRFSWDERIGIRNDKLLTWQQIKEMSQSKIEFGTHTATHPNLAMLNKEQVRQELVQSKNKLEEMLDKKTQFFSYPFGSLLHINETTKQIVSECGFHCSLTSLYGTVDLNSDIFQLKRISIDGSDDFYLFQKKVNGVLDILSCFSSRFCQIIFSWLNGLLGLDI